MKGGKNNWREKSNKKVGNWCNFLLCVCVGLLVCYKLILMGNTWHCLCVSNGKTMDERWTMFLFWNSYDLWQWQGQHENLVDVFKKWVHNGKDKRPNMWKTKHFFFVFKDCWDVNALTWCWFSFCCGCLGGMPIVRIYVSPISIPFNCILKFTSQIGL